MEHVCTVCGSTGAEAVNDAKALGLELELRRGIYTCCQITQWALEQLLAWAEAAQDERTVAEQEETAGELVPVRLRKPPADRLKNPERRG
ncbi:MAG: hypothetical protein WBW33_04180 [Bryobacteraceae bacterium]